MEINENSTPGEMQISGFWRRLFAFVFDSMLLGFIGFLFGLVFFDFFAGLGGWGRLIGFVVSIIYFGVTDSRIFDGQSVGKIALKIKVVSSDGALLSPAKALVRAIIFAIPYFLNNALIDYTATPMLALCIAGFLVFGLGGSIVYLLIFNRRTRQSVHDLVVGSYVVRLGTGKMHSPSLPLWRGHVAILALIFTVTASAPVWLDHFKTTETFASLIVLQRKMTELPNVKFIFVNSGQSSFYSSETGARTRSFIAIRAMVTSGDVDSDEIADKIAQIVLSDYPEIDKKDFVGVTLVYGYDIGISSQWKSKEIVHSIPEWRQRMRTNSGGVRP